MKLERKDLDRLMPLESGSHENVSSLEIAIPMRYAECAATLENGQKTRLKDRRQLLGWTLNAERRRFYFQVGKRVVVIATNRNRRHQIRRIECWADHIACFALTSDDLRVARLGGEVHKLVSPDGSLLFIAEQRPAGSDMPARLPITQPANASVSLAT